MSELSALINLKRLNLQDNQIYRISYFENLKNLEFFNIQNNKLVSCEPLEKLPIYDLKANNNLITDIEYITKMPKYQHEWVSTY